MYRNMTPYAHGGPVVRKDIIEVHMNPFEVEELEKIQGSSEIDPHTGLRTFSGLESVFKNPHIMNSFLHNVEKMKKSYASGGMVGGYDPYYEELAANGEHGDTEIVGVGPLLNRVLHKIALPGTTTNHRDGRPQFWSVTPNLGSLWNTVSNGANSLSNSVQSGINAVGNGVQSGLNSAGNTIRSGINSVGNGIQMGAQQGWNDIKNAATDAAPYIESAAKTAAPYVGKIGNAVLPMATQSLEQLASEKYGPAGAAGVAALSGLAGKGFDYLSNYGDDTQQGIAQTAADGITAGVQARQAGQSPFQSTGAAIGRMGQRIPGATGDFIQGAGRSMQNNGTLSQIASQGTRQAFNNNGGWSGVGQAAGAVAQPIYDDYKSNQRLPQMARNVGARGYDYARSRLPSNQAISNQNAMQQLPFHNG